MTIGYYRVSMPTNTPFVGVLQECDEYDPYGEDLRVMSENYCLRLDNLSKVGPVWHGDLVRFDLAENAVYGRIDKPVNPVDLQPEEAIAQQTAFIYNPSLNVLCLQKNRQGVTPPRFARFFDSFESVFGEIELLQVYSQNTIERLRGIERFHRMELKVAGGQQGRSLQDDDETSLDQALDICEAYNAEALNLEVTVSRKWRSKALDEGGVRGLVRDVFGFDIFGSGGSKFEPDERVERLVIKGETTQEESDEIELISEAIRDQVRLPTDADRVLTYDTRLGAIRAEYEGRLKQFQRMYAN